MPASTLDDVLAVLSAVLAGDPAARVSLPEAPPADTVGRLALAVNQVLDLQAAERRTYLRQSDDNFSKAFHASPAAMSIARLPEGRWLEVNDALVAMTGYTREEALGRTSGELGVVDEAARAKIIAAIQRDGLVRNVEIQARTKTGQLIDVLVSVEQIELNGAPCALTIQYDITERKRAEREVLRLNADLQARQSALEAANQELESFSYSVAHDLRAPLRSIDGFSQILLEDYAAVLDADGRQNLDRVREAAQRMNRLIDDLLSLARVSRTDLRREPVDLSLLAWAVLNRLQLSEPGRAAEFVIADGLIAQSDTHLLGILLENLLGNAWKFTSQRPLARIEIGAQPGENGPTYFVRDNGAGFDMAYAHKLFGVFQRLHNDRDYAGTGIGLAIVQRIVNRHGGRIWAEAAVDQGATFYFTL